MHLLKSYRQKNGLDTVKTIFCNVIRCSIGVYDFTHLKRELLTSEVISAVDMQQRFIENKNKITFWGWKPLKNKNM